jgi:hypothetical protein
MVFTTNKDKGRAGMSMAIAYFGSNGYTVSIPLNDTQWYDLVIEKDGVFQTVQCKATGNCENGIALRSMGGNARKAYDNVLNHPVDLLFCLDADQNMYVIPMSVIRAAGNRNGIKLSAKHRKQGIDTAEYLVHL